MFFHRCVSLPEGDTKSSVIVSDSTNSCSTCDNDSYENENDTTKKEEWYCEGLRNPAQFRDVVYPIMCISTIQGDAELLPSTVVPILWVKQCHKPPIRE